jgi:hypothetical protein
MQSCAIGMLHDNAQLAFEDPYMHSEHNVSSLLVFITSISPLILYCYYCVPCYCICYNKHTGGGRNPISPRLLRHFNLICFADFDDATLTRIFDTIGMYYSVYEIHLYVYASITIALMH